ncbi:MAG: glycerophosphodiester phosphodiesterase [Rhizobiaceae bacterium]|nr:glycerophosphodiester phosphodiesterase [Rhizobiaceae bacterium]
MTRTDLAWLTERPIAHRGLHDLNHEVWENTLSAFERAMQRGFAIECDVHLTADNQVVVFHDDTLGRLTGADGFVWQRTASEMTALRIGGTNDHPPLLSELLELVNGEVPLIIELKGIPGHDEGLVQAVGKLLSSYRGKAAIMSFDHWLIRQFSELPNIPAGLTALGTDNKDIEAHFSMLGNGIDFVSYCLAHLPNPFVNFIQTKLDMPLITWTVRDEAAVRLSAELGGQITFEGIDPENVIV